MDQSRRAVESYWRSRMVDGVTADDDKVAPVYKLEEICELLRASDASIVKEVADFILLPYDHASLHLAGLSSSDGEAAHRAAVALDDGEAGVVVAAALLVVVVVSPPYAHGGVLAAGGDDAAAAAGGEAEDGEAVALEVSGVDGLAGGGLLLGFSQTLT